MSRTAPSAPPHASPLWRVAAGVGVIFGLVTLMAGGRVLLGADPGYVVYKPLLLFNTAMGLAYLTVGVLSWRRHALALPGAALVALANLGVLVALALRFEPGGPIATTSLGAMSFRTAVWVILFLLLRRAARRGAPHADGG